MVILGEGLLDCDGMQQLSSDEIASMLLARLVREVENFASGCQIGDAAKIEDIWNRFLEHLKNGRAPKPSVTKGRKKMPSTRCQ
jgi:hypothetical protein